MSVWTKLNSILREVGGIPKDAVNTEQRYAYRSEEAVMERLRGLVAKAGLVFLVREPAPASVVDSGGRSQRGAISWRGLAYLEFQFVDAETGEATGWMGMTGEGLDYGDKALSKAQTFATKYFLSKTFMLSSGGDAEGDAQTDRDPALAGESASEPAQGRAPAPPRRKSEAAARRQSDDATTKGGDGGATDGYPRTSAPVIVTGTKRNAYQGNYQGRAWARHDITVANEEGVEQTYPTYKDNVIEDAIIAAEGAFPVVLVIGQDKKGREVILELRDEGK